MIDDIIDTAGTLVKTAEALIKHGATKVFAACTHPVFSGPAAERIMNSEIEEVVVTDSVPLNGAAQKLPKITVLSVAPFWRAGSNRFTKRLRSASSSFDSVCLVLDKRRDLAKEGTYGNIYSGRQGSRGAR